MDLQSLYFPENEKPLDRLVTDGGFAAIFRSYGCVGDSLSSGEFESVGLDGVRHYHDYYEYSWGQFLARAAGSTTRNFSRGGMSAKEYCEGWAESMGYWDPALACDAYIIALGVNDLFNQHQEVGSPDDIDMNDWRNNKKTFTGYYAQIIQRLKEIRPDAKFFLMTTPKNSRADEAAERYAVILRDLLFKLAELFDNTYVINLYDYAPEYDESFRRKFYLHGHMNPMGYVLTAQMTASYIDYIIRHNMDDFREVGFIGRNVERQPV